jgi:hypothetical protein
LFPILQEFDHVRERTTWIKMGEGDQVAEDDCKQHGTAMLSLVVGKTVGVAKNANPIIVRLPCRGRGVGLQPPDWIDALGKIHEHIDTSKPSVVLMASYWTKIFFPGPDGADDWDGFAAAHKRLMDALAAKGAVLVTGTGNDGTSTVDGFPANYGKPGNLNVPSLLVMGGLYADGTTGIWGNTDLAAGLPHAYAPGRNVMVADRDLLDLRSSSGTSCSAALTAGLAAYYLRLAQLNRINSDTSPQAIKDFIVGTSWSRKDFDNLPRPGIWNSVDVNAPASEWTPNTKRAAVLFRREFYA